MSAHTPGPWVYWVNSRGFGVSQEQGAPYTRHYSDVGSLTFETVTGELRAIQEANARLIAAAPELLNALVEASVALRIGHNSLVALEKARAAIAKATGESQ